MHEIETFAANQIRQEKRQLGEQPLVFEVVAHVREIRGDDAKLDDAEIVIVTFPQRRLGARLRQDDQDVVATRP
jgi:hypothetical protein